MRTLLTTLMFAAGLAAPASAQAPALDPDVCDQKPVIMLVAGSIADWPRIRAYGQAIRDSGLYDRLGGYYINVPRAVAVFEGAPPPDQSMLMVRFPCLAHARAFWHSRQYQEQLKPLRLNPSAGSFTVTVYPEAAPPPGVAAHWPPLGSLTRFPPEVAAAVPQAAPQVAAKADQ